MNLLLLALLPLAEAVVKPNITKQISRSSQHFLSLSNHNSSNAACPGHCEDGWAYFSDTDACYKNFFDANFNDAEYLCNFLGGHLASIHSFKENVFVAELAKMGPERDKWTWTDGTKLDIVLWASNSPDPKWKGEKRCVMLISDPYVDVTSPLNYQDWTDTFRCSEKFRSFVCKKMALH